MCRPERCSEPVRRSLRKILRLRQPVAGQLVVPAAEDMELQLECLESHDEPEVIERHIRWKPPLRGRFFKLIRLDGGSGVEVDAVAAGLSRAVQGRFAALQEGR